MRELTNEEGLELYAEQWNAAYWALWHEFQNSHIFETDVMRLEKAMETAWDIMETLIPQSHYDEINAVVYNIHRR